MKPASIRALEMALEREAFGQHLRRLRQQRALSQEAAAHEIGCSVKSLQLESYMASMRDTSPPASQLERIEAKLDRVLRELARREGEREP